MSEEPGNSEPPDDRSEPTMTEDTDDEYEQVDIENRDMAQEAESEPRTADEEPAAEDTERRIDDDLRRKLNYALLFGLGFLALIAVVQFYLNMSRVIDQWVTREFRSLFQALFNLVVLLVVGAAISRQVKRLAD